MSLKVIDEKENDYFDSFVTLISHRHTHFVLDMQGSTFLIIKLFLNVLKCFWNKYWIVN